MHSPIAATHRDMHSPIAAADAGAAEGMERCRRAAGAVLLFTSLFWVPVPGRVGAWHAVLLETNFVLVWLRVSDAAFLLC